MVAMIKFKFPTLCSSRSLAIIASLMCLYSLNIAIALFANYNHRNNMNNNNNNIHFKTYNDGNPDHFFRNTTKITFVTSYYRATTTSTTNNRQQQIPDTRRQSELDICLASVVGNPILDSIHILGLPIDLSQLPGFAKDAMIGGNGEPFGGEERWDNYTTAHRKVVLIEKKERPMMGTFFEYICEQDQKQQQQQQQRLQKQKQDGDEEEDDNRLVMFSNADILFDTSLEYFMRLSTLESQSRFYALSTWAMTHERGLSPESNIGFEKYDSFVFSPKSICRDSKQKWKELVRELNYPMGRLGAENRLLFEIKRLFPELKLINPARTVKTVHWDQSPNRSDDWGGRVNLDGRTAWIDDEDIV